MDTIKSSIKSSFNNDTKITKYTWSIHKDDISKFKDLACTSHTQSNLFSTNDFPNIVWRLRCYPNGSNKNSCGSCKIFLRLKSFPKEYKNIFVYYYIRCLETNSCIENVNEFSKTTDFSGWNTRTQLTSDLNKFSSITFETGIRILKIQNINNLSIYNYLLPVSSIKKQYKIEWNISNNLFLQLKKSHNGKWICGTLLSHKNDMFSIACCPNGEKENDCGYLSLFFIILTFPNNVESIKINFTLKCLQINKIKTETYIFSEKDKKCSRGWPRFCSINELLNINSMNIICVADIIEMYDKNNETIYNISDEKEEFENTITPPSQIRIKNYNTEIVSELINLGCGTREECIAASLLVINQNDINEVKDKVYELQNVEHKMLKSPTTIIESNQFNFNSNINNSIAEPFNNNNNKNRIRSNINNTFDIETKIFKFQWKINENDIFKFKNLSTGLFVGSDEFATFITNNNNNITNISWTVRCYPNGMNSLSNNSCKMYLCLDKTSFDNIYCISIYYYIRCIETETCTEFIRKFTKSENNSGWKTRRQLSSELNKSFIKTITFEIGIRILSIIDLNKNIIYRYPLSLSQIKKEYKLNWHINQNLLNVFKQSHYSKSIDATLLSSKNHMFSIQCYPNGYDETHQGFLSLYFICVSFPINVYSMKVKFKLKCSTLKYIKEYIFSKEKYGRGWDKFCVAKSAYLNTKTIDITCDIQIIELYDKNNNIINTNGAITLQNISSNNKNKNNNNNN
eukprot:366558_1